MDQERIAQAIDACYDAVLAPETLPEALHGLARAHDAAAAMLYPIHEGSDHSDPRDPTRPVELTPMSPEYTPLIEEYVRNKWYLNHYRAERGFPLLDAGRAVVIEHDLATDEERRRLRQYNELYLRYGFTGYAMISIRTDGRRWVVPMLRGAVQGHFTPGDARRLARLAPYVGRLLRLSERFALGRAQGQLDLLDRLACAAVLIDWKGAVIARNGAAEALMGGDLRVSRGTLVAADPAGNRALQGLIRQLRGMSPSLRGVALPERVFIRRTGGPPLSIEALPVGGRTADLLGSAHALLTITDLVAPPPVPEAALRAAFGLTAAEARLASRVAAGETLKDAADALGIAKNTARVQLRAVFAKTGVSRQADLVARLVPLARSPTDKDQ